VRRGVRYSFVFNQKEEKPASTQSHSTRTIGDRRVCNDLMAYPSFAGLLYFLFFFELLDYRAFIYLHTTRRGGGRTRRILWRI
jgi:hypothetical protein